MHNVQSSQPVRQIATIQNSGRSTVLLPPGESQVSQRKSYNSGLLVRGFRAASTVAIQIPNLRQIRRPFMKSLTLRWALATTLVLCILASPIAWQRLQNDSRLAEMRRALLDIKHPRGTSGIRSIAQFGNLTGTSNHCDYVVAELRSTDRPRAEIERHYRGVRIVSPVTGQVKSLSLLFKDSSQPPFEALLLIHMNELGRWGLVEAIEGYGSDRYIVFATESHSPGCDLRCH